MGVAAAGTGTLTGLKLKQGKDAGAAPRVSGQGQSPKGGTAPKKKPAKRKNNPTVTKLLELKYITYKVIC